MNRAWRGLTVLLPAILLYPGALHASGETPIREVVRGSTVWSGKVPVDGVVIVAKGGTLKIVEGTTVVFAPRDDDGDGIGDSELRVEGTILVEGTPSSPVVFTSGSPRPAPADWKYIMINHADGVTMTDALIEYAFSGIQVHYTRGTFTRLRARHNVDGFRFSTAPVRLSDSRLTGNVNGIRYEERGAGAQIRGNAISGNSVGIFAVIKCRGLTVFEDNIIEGNADYNVKVGERQSEDVPMGSNWWGSSVPGTIEDGFFDGRVDPALGRVVYEPYLVQRPLRRVVDPEY